MIKTPVKFHKKQYKTVGGAALTRCLLHIHFHRIESWKKSKLTQIKILLKAHAYHQTMIKTSVKSVLIIRRSFAHKVRTTNSESNEKKSKLRM